MAAQRESVQPSNESRQRHIATSLAPSPCAAVILETAPFNVYAAVAYVYGGTHRQRVEGGRSVLLCTLGRPFPPPSLLDTAFHPLEGKAGVHTHARAHTHTRPSSFPLR